MLRIPVVFSYVILGVKRREVTLILMLCYSLLGEKSELRYQEKHSFHAFY
jgi:hypothetical protein